MQRNRIPWLALVATVVGLGACGDDGSSIELEDAPGRIADVLCEQYAKCQSPLVLMGSMGGSETCKALVELQFQEVVESAQQDIQAGRTSYDGTLAKTCLDKLSRAGCRPIDTIPECEQVFSGTLGEGKTCSQDWECASGWCDDRVGCPGTCARPVGEGGTCKDGERCDVGLVCTPDGTCVAYGEPAGIGESCEYRVCQEGLYCTLDRVCAQRKQEGAPCTGDPDLKMECAEGLMCIQGHCQQPTLVTEEGGSCDPEQGKFCDVDSHLFCAVVLGGGGQGRVCKTMPHEGDVCYDAATRTGVACDLTEPLYCDFDEAHPDQDGHCRPRKDDGASCEKNEECLSGLCESGACLPKSSCG